MIKSHSGDSCHKGVCRYLSEILRLSLRNLGLLYKVQVDRAVPENGIRNGGQIKRRRNPRNLRDEAETLQFRTDAVNCRGSEEGKGHLELLPRAIGQILLREEVHADELTPLNRVDLSQDLDIFGAELDRDPQHFAREFRIWRWAPQHTPDYDQPQPFYALLRTRLLSPCDSLNCSLGSSDSTRS